MSEIEEPCPVCGVVEWAEGRRYERELILKAFESEDYRGNGPTFTLADVRRIIKGENK